MFLDGYSPATISNKFNIPLSTVMYHANRLENKKIIQRIHPTSTPIFYEKGSEFKIFENVTTAFRRGSSLSARLHALGIQAEIVRTNIHSIEWDKEAVWGNCRFYQKEMTIKDMAVTIRLMGNKLIIFIPPQMVDKRDLANYNQLIENISITVINHLEKTYGFKFGIIELLQKPEIAFPIKNERIRRVIKKYQLRRDNWWEDCSDGKGEIETRDVIEAQIMMDVPGEIRRLKERQDIMEAQFKQIIQIVGKNSDMVENMTTRFSELMEFFNKMKSQSKPPEMRPMDDWDRSMFR